MPAQSRASPVPLLLTRPEPQAADFARQLTARFGDQIRIIPTPLLAPRFYSPALPDGLFAGLILTSQTGVAAYLQLDMEWRALPRIVHCVGARTADAAQAAGLRPVSIAPDATRLIADIKAQGTRGRLLHLRGREARGDIAAKLNFAEIDTVEAVIYAQEQQALTAKAQDVLQDRSPVLVSLFSPRSAVIFAAEMARIRGISPLFVAAMSDEVARELPTETARISVAGTPDADAMLICVMVLLANAARLNAAARAVLDTPAA